jgi:hypothetical protein
MKTGEGVTYYAPTEARDMLCADMIRPRWHDVYRQKHHLSLTEGLQGIEIIFGQADVEAFAVHHQTEETIFLTQAI